MYIYLYETRGRLRSYGFIDLMRAPREMRRAVVVISTALFLQTQLKHLFAHRGAIGKEHVRRAVRLHVGEIRSSRHARAA